MVMVSVPHESQTLSSRLIKLIEGRADELSRAVVVKLQTNPRTASYRRLSFEELYANAYDVYHDLGRWLLEKTDLAVQARYTSLGKTRFGEGVQLSEILWALVLTKNQLRQYLAAWALADSAVELYRQQEFDRLIAQFFDQAAYHVANTYEKERIHETHPIQPAPGRRRLLPLRVIRRK
jgi:hypothetical protein